MSICLSLHKQSPSQENAPPAVQLKLAWVKMLSKRFLLDPPKNTPEGAKNSKESSEAPGMMVVVDI